MNRCFLVVRYNFSVCLFIFLLKFHNNWFMLSTFVHVVPELYVSAPEDIHGDELCLCLHVCMFVFVCLHVVPYQVSDTDPIIEEPCDALQLQPSFSPPPGLSPQWVPALHFHLPFKQTLHC